MHSFAQRFGLRPLVNKLAAFIGEVDLSYNRDKHCIVATVNSIVGGDLQQVEEKHKDTQTVLLPTRFTISCNSLPNFTDPSGAFANRMLVLTYHRTWEQNPDTELGSSY